MAKLPWHNPLFPVKGHLAERYAAALTQITGDACPLAEFDIDRFGWSPQLAALLGEDYLGGEALRHAIILSPDQAAAPPIRRRFSYEADLIEAVYLEARATLLELVTREAVVIEIDNDLAFCRNAVDVAGIKSAVAKIDTPKHTLQKSVRLLELSQGLGEQSRLLDESYIDQMIALARDVGDPRKRVLPPELRQPVRSLWAEVDGAVYVLRPPEGKPGDTFVIATRPEGLAHLPVRGFELGDARLVDTLHEAGFLRYAIDSSLPRKRLGELELEALLAAGLDTQSANGTARRKQLDRNPTAQAALPKVYWELHSLQQQLEAGAQFDPRRLSVDARWALSAPNRNVEIVGHLLARFVRYDHRMLALHHRRSIQAEWSRYSEAKRRHLEATFPYMTQGFIRKPDAPATNAAQSAAGQQAPAQEAGASA